jgi:hypothetical protein
MGFLSVCCVTVHATLYKLMATHCLDRSDHADRRWVCMCVCVCVCCIHIYIHVCVYGGRAFKEEENLPVGKGPEPVTIVDAQQTIGQEAAKHARHGGPHKEQGESHRQLVMAVPLCHQIHNAGEKAAYRARGTLTVSINAKRRRMRNATATCDIHTHTHTHTNTHTHTITHTDAGVPSCTVLSLSLSLCLARALASCGCSTEGKSILSRWRQMHTRACLSA